MALAAISALVFVGVAVHELDYAGGHPYRYGPAKVIAWGAGGGALLSLAVGLLGRALSKSASGEGASGGTAAGWSDD